MWSFPVAHEHGVGVALLVPQRLGPGDPKGSFHHKARSVAPGMGRSIGFGAPLTVRWMACLPTRNGHARNDSDPSGLLEHGPDRQRAPVWVLRGAAFHLWSPRCLSPDMSWAYHMHSSGKQARAKCTRLAAPASQIGHQEPRATTCIVQAKPEKQPTLRNEGSMMEKVSF